MCKSLTLGAVVLLAACFPPGATVNVVAASPAGVTLEYTHSVSTELPAAIRRAEAVCQTYGKHARQHTMPQQLDVDRSVVNFDCVH